MNPLSTQSGHADRANEYLCEFDLNHFGLTSYARFNHKMAEKHSRPTFKPKPFLDGSGWHVDAEWPDGVTQHVDDFGSDSEAREWIAKKSDAWLQKHPLFKQPPPSGKG
jgi:hypothetical protein